MHACTGNWVVAFVPVAMQSYAVWDNQQDITLLALPQQREEEDYCCAQVG